MESYCEIQYSFGDNGCLNNGEDSMFVSDTAGVDVKKARSAEVIALRQDVLYWAEHGYDPAVKDLKTGGTPLHVAAAKGYMDVSVLIFFYNIVLK